MEMSGKPTTDLSALNLSETSLGTVFLSLGTVFLVIGTLFLNKHWVKCVAQMKMDLTKTTYVYSNDKNAKVVFQHSINE